MHAVSYTLLYSTLSEAMSTLLDILFFPRFLYIISCVPKILLRTCYGWSCTTYPHQMVMSLAYTLCDSFCVSFICCVSFIRLMHIYPNNNNQKRKITKMEWRYHWYSKCWWWEMKNVRKKTRFFIVNTCALKLIHAQLSCFHVYFWFLNKCPGIISFITW